MTDTKNIRCLLVLIQKFRQFTTLYYALDTLRCIYHFYHNYQSLDFFVFIAWLHVTIVTQGMSNFDVQGLDNEVICYLNQIAPCFFAIKPICQYQSKENDMMLLHPKRNTTSISKFYVTHHKPRNQPKCKQVECFILISRRI